MGLPEEKVELLPSWVDLDRFRPRVRTSLTSACCGSRTSSPERRAGYLAVQQWAENHDVPFDAYGRGCPNGPVRYEDVPSLMAAHRWYGHAMGDGDYEPYGRATIEAWAAGCHLIVGEEVGAVWWIENHPDKLETAHTDFGSWWRTSASYQRDRPHHPRQEQSLARCVSAFHGRSDGATLEILVIEGKRNCEGSMVGRRRTIHGRLPAVVR